MKAPYAMILNVKGAEVGPEMRAAMAHITQLWGPSKDAWLRIRSPQEFVNSPGLSGFITICPKEVQNMLKMVIFITVLCENISVKKVCKV
jgi:hypothetical protein